jgi:hypothetical protein
MYELKQLLIVLGLSAAPTAATVNIGFYKDQLKTEIIKEQNYQVELKAVEYKQMWVEVSVDDEGRKKVEKIKLHESEVMAKGRLMETKKKIKVLKYIIEQDSIREVKPATSEL